MWHATWVRSALWCATEGWGGIMNRDVRLALRKAVVSNGQARLGAHFGLEERGCLRYAQDRWASVGTQEGLCPARTG